MIHTLTLRNFKSVGEQSYDFTDFDLLVGRNNSGKSTVLQALAIWQFCVDEFHRAKRSGSTGIQIVLPNFTALPVPEFNLLWKDRTDRFYPLENGAKKQKFILIEILVAWRDPANVSREFGVELRYHSPQTIYATPVGGWAAFRECEKSSHLPRIAFVPPFSGLEPSEKWLDVAPTRQQVGKGQPGSVLRNLLLRVCPAPPKDQNGKVLKGYKVPDDWTELANVVQRWFSVELLPPQYDSAKDVHIDVEYRQNGKTYDLISGGSGFHQTMTLLAFLYGYQPTTILLDEPDAHLHVNLQREILDYFKKKSAEKGVQFLIATHAEEFAKGVDPSQILSLLKQVPKRIESTPEVLRAMSAVSNEEITGLMGSPYILYVEGESDERMLRAWAPACGALPVMVKIYFKVMGGGNKPEMLRLASEHFDALKHVVPDVRRLMLFDYDNSDQAFHPPANNPSLMEWRRKNIENYLLVPPAWRREALQVMQLAEDDLFAQPVLQTIDDFFASENLTLPAGKTWRNLTANIFSVVDGKRMLFENNTSLFHALRKGEPSIDVLRERVAAVMTADEIHEDVHQFFGKLIAMVNPPALKKRLTT
ncbi:MAG: AAA family ATPase [Rhodoferax sp.]|uniref:ATP-dependent nuclease n=2 Tax=Rhodoferax sp. TaxID=50421 RepID=UPI003BAEAE37